MVGAGSFFGMGDETFQAQEIGNLGRVGDAPSLPSSTLGMQRHSQSTPKMATQGAFLPALHETKANHSRRPPQQRGVTPEVVAQRFANYTGMAAAKEKMKEKQLADLKRKALHLSRDNAAIVKENKRLAKQSELMQKRHDNQHDANVHLRDHLEE